MRTTCSRFLHAVVNASISSIFEAEECSSVCVCVCAQCAPHCVHPSPVRRHLCRFHLPAPVGNAAANDVCANTSLSLCFQSCGHAPRSGVAGSCGRAVFSFLRHRQTIFHSSCPTVRSPRRSARGLGPAHQHRYFLVF